MSTACAANWVTRVANPCCKPGEAAVTCFARAKPRGKNPPRKPTAERRNLMLDSVRSRLTLWYSALFGLFLILLAGLSYFLYWRNSVEHLDSNLLELSDPYIATLNAELRDDDQQDGGIRTAARAAMLEHRFRDVVYAIVDDQGHILSSSLDLPAGS